MLVQEELPSAPTVQSWATLKPSSLEGVPVPFLIPYCPAQMFTTNSFPSFLKGSLCEVQMLALKDAERTPGLPCVMFHWPPESLTASLRGGFRAPKTGSPEGKLGCVTTSDCDHDSRGAPGSVQRTGL